MNDRNTSTYRAPQRLCTVYRNDDLLSQHGVEPEAPRNPRSLPGLRIMRAIVNDSKSGPQYVRAVLVAIAIVAVVPCAAIDLAVIAARLIHGLNRQSRHSAQVIAKVGLLYPLVVVIGLTVVSAHLAFAPKAEAKTVTPVAEPAALASKAPGQ